MLWKGLAREKKRGIKNHTVTKFIHPVYFSQSCTVCARGNDCCLRQFVCIFAADTKQRAEIQMRSIETLQKNDGSGKEYDDEKNVSKVT